MSAVMPAPPETVQYLWSVFVLSSGGETPAVPSNVWIVRDPVEPPVGVTSTGKYPVPVPVGNVNTACGESGAFASVPPSAGGGTRPPEKSFFKAQLTWPVVLVIVPPLPISSVPPPRTLFVWSETELLAVRL